jgi:S1-C subfamily serine protease
MMLNRMALFFLLMVALTGCQNVPSSQVMVNPDTGEGKVVSHHSWGYGMAGVAAAIGAQQAQKSDIEAMKKAGYVEIEKVGTSGFKFTSKAPLDPPVVGEVHPNGPAANAGMKTGDLITHRNGVEIKNIGELKSQPRVNIGETTEWRVLRNGKTIIFTVVAVPISQMVERK